MMYRELANAVVLQAVREFRPAYSRLKRFPNDQKAADRVREITEFFCSDRFCLFTNLDGPVLLTKIMRDVDERIVENEKD